MSSVCDALGIRAGPCPPGTSRAVAPRLSRYRLRRIGVTTPDGASTFGFAVLWASNWAAFRLPWRHPLN